jgi:chromosome partitioning protein
MIPGRRAYIVVFGNEKGGSGKTTTSVHLIAGLMWAGFTVASIDLDGRQRSLTRYLDNRRITMRAENADLPCPNHHVLTASTLDSVRAARAEDHQNLAELVATLATTHDFIVVDCPGSDAHLSRAAHRLADTLITPLNDSLLDLDMVVRLDPVGGGFEGAGTYAAMVVEQRRKRLARGGAGMDWILLRNRMAPLSSRNSTMIGDTLNALSRQVGCRIAKGVGERVIYRQLFLRGLTVLDLTAAKSGGDAGRQAAQAEIRELLDALWLPSLSRRLARM